MEEDTFSILVATDIHLGYGEKKPELCSDSFTAFEEILQIAKKRNVDFILLGGDLFHENKPSRKTRHATIELLKKYCFGDRPCEFEIVSDQIENFGKSSKIIKHVNYEDPNINISIPVFSIHGNHDDPTGSDELSAIDLLGAYGLINHFGKQTNLEHLKISPVLMVKGKTKLALYGLGSMKDERLHRLFLRKQVTMIRPKEFTDEWLNVMVIHQNRVSHSRTNYIPEEFLDDFLDLVIWGHEHECLIQPQLNVSRNFLVMQPGSSVATSLCEGEAEQKKVAILKIRGREMKVDIIPLQTVRQMYVETIFLEDELDARKYPLLDQRLSVVKSFLEQKVEDLLSRANSERSGNEKQPKKPLIRLRINYGENFETFPTYQFGATFSDRVANPDSIIHFLKKSACKKSRGSNQSHSGAGEDLVGTNVEKLEQVEDFVKEFLNSKGEDQLSLLTTKGLNSALSEFVYKQEKESVSEMCNHQITRIQKSLNLSDVERSSVAVREEVVQVRNEILFKNHEDQIEEVKKESAKNISKMDEESSASDDGISSMAPSSQSTRISSRGRGAKRGSRKGTTRGRGRSTRGKSTSNNESDLTAYFTSSQTSSTKSRNPIRKTQSRCDESSSVFDTIPETDCSTLQYESQEVGSSMKKRSKSILADLSSSDDADEEPFTFMLKKRQK